MLASKQWLRQRDSRATLKLGSPPLRAM